MEMPPICAPFRNQVEPGEEAEESLEFSQNTTLQYRLKSTTLWAAPLQDILRWLFTSKTTRSKLAFDCECHISRHFRLPVKFLLCKSQTSRTQ